MTKVTKRTGCAKSIPAGLAIGTAVAMGITFLGCAISAKLVDMEIIEESNIGYAIMTVLLIASYASAVTSYSNVKRRKVLVCVASCVCYILALILMTALFFGGNYESVIETTAVVLSGTMLALLFEKKQHKRAGKKKIRIANC